MLIMKVMVVEDEIYIREGISRLLTRLGGDYEMVGEAENGLQGCEMAVQLRPDIIITDIRMPVMDGLESARRIRTSGRPDARRIPIIALTANAFDEDTRKSLASGMNGHLSKPIQVDQMLETLGKCMGLKK